MPGDIRDDVVLVADDGTPIGTAPRATVHSHDTALHLAFSCYVFRRDGRLLVTRRALSKTTWPGVWTNSFCGHPRPGEPVTDAITRYGVHELMLPVNAVRSVLPNFRYRAVDASGTAENEICPVYFAATETEPDPNPDEVMDLRWIEPQDLVRLVHVAPWAVSPWVVAQVAALADHGVGWWTGTP